MTKALVLLIVLVVASCTEAQPGSVDQETSTSSLVRGTTVTTGSVATVQPTDNGLTGQQRIALLADIYEGMGVEPCCGEDPGVGQVGVLGFTFGDNHISVSSGDFVFLAQGLDGADPEVAFNANDDETVVLFRCGDNWYLIENLVDGLVAPVPDDAVTAFIAGAGCTVER